VKNANLQFYSLLCYCCLLLFLPLGLSAQSELESLQKKIARARGDEAHELTIQLAKAYYEINSDSSIAIIRKLLFDESKKLAPLLQADAYNTLSTALQLQSRYSEALAEARKAQDLYENLNDTSGLSSIFTNLGTIFYYRSNYQLALEYYLRALRLKEALGQDNGVASLRCNIGNIYINQKQFEQARIHYEQAQETFVRLGNKRGISYTHNNLGVIFEETGEFDQAISSYLNAYQLDKELGDNFGLASSHFNMGEIYFKTNRLNLAQEQYQKSLEIGQDISHPISITRALTGLAKIETLKANYQATVRYARQALQIARSIDHKPDQKAALELLAEAYDYLNESKRSLVFYKELVAVNDSLQAEDRRLALSEIQARYESERKEQEIQLLQKDKQLQDAQILRQSLMNRIYIAAIAMVILVLIVLINRFQLIRRNEQLLRKVNLSLENKVNERTRDLQAAFDKAEKADRLKTFFLSNINNELRAPLNGIVGMSDYLQENAEDGTIKEVAESVAMAGKRLAETLAAVLELSRLEAEELELEREVILPEPYIRDVVAEFMPQIESKNLKFLLENYAPQKKVAVHLMSFKRILKSLLHNAVKFTNKGLIKIELLREVWKGEQMLSIRIIDSGVGIPEQNLQEIFDAFRIADVQLIQEPQGLGIGLTLASKYAQLLGGQISLDSREGQGSVFTLRLPLYE
jgi:signal transduction histidine kinase/tetratricopeptide (TPR) repeat protein